MTKRPNLFNQDSMEETLRNLGCPPSSIAPTISNYRLFVPLLFAELGEERIFEIVCQAQEGLRLGEQHSAWRSAIKYIVAWSDTVIEDYKVRRNIAVPPPVEKDTQQPRLL